MIVGDLHEKENLGYSEYIKDGRRSEKREIFNFLVDQSKDCDKVVFMGDVFNGRNNPSTVIAGVTRLIERFGKKEIYILGGNHDKKADGTSALDYLKEVRKPNWHVITDEVTVIGDMVFCPYFTRQELGCKTNEEAEKMLMKMITGRKKKMLFVHHAISGTKVTKNVTTDFFNEIVLKRAILEKEYEFVCGGHIHAPTQEDNLVVTGSIFNNEVGEHGKFIWKYGDKIEKIALPGRGIYKVENDIAEIKKIPSGSIVKFILTEKTDDIEAIETTLKAATDAYLLLERYPRTRKKSKALEGMSFDFNPETLLEVYAKERDVDIKKLKKAYNLIKE